MRTKSKHVYCKSYSSYVVYPEDTTPWSDVWVYYNFGRKKRKLFLTFYCADKIDEQIIWQKERNAIMRESVRERLANPITKRSAKEKEEDEANGIYRFDPDWEPKIEWYEDQNTELLDLEWIKQYLEEYPNSIYGVKYMHHNMEGGMDESEYFEIIVKKELNRKAIEEGVMWYLKNHKAIWNVDIKIHWKKNKKKFFTTSM